MTRVKYATNYLDSDEYAADQDRVDPLAKYRREFLFPRGPDGREVAYFAGNSLGLQPSRARAYVLAELEDWERHGVEGHFRARKPWLPYHERLTALSEKLVGARSGEVVVMNTLTVNLHLMLVSFYRPTEKRNRILIEAGAFPSDRYAVASQANFHGFDPGQVVVEAPGPEEVIAAIEREGDRLALVLLGSVNYLTGQAFDVAKVTRAAHAVGAAAGFDFAHGAGNLKLRLHDDGPDFAVWCGYKYLSGGPGAPSGCFVHSRHGRSFDLPRFSGWWGHDKATRFAMPPSFLPIEGAEGWQLSNPPIFSMAALQAALEIFDSAGMDPIREKSVRLTGYLEFLLDRMPRKSVELLTPRDPAQRGAQLSLRLPSANRGLVGRLALAGVVCDFREPNVLRAAPAPLYCGFADVRRLVAALRAHVGTVAS